MTQLLLLLLWRYRCDFDIEKLQHSSLAPYFAYPLLPKIPNPKLARHFAKNNHRNQMADKRQKWPQNEIMFQVTQYPAPSSTSTSPAPPPPHHTSTTTLGKVSQVRGGGGEGKL